MLHPSVELSTFLPWTGVLQSADNKHEKRFPRPGFDGNPGRSGKTCWAFLPFSAHSEIPHLQKPPFPWPKSARGSSCFLATSCRLYTCLYHHARARRAGDEQSIQGKSAWTCARSWPDRLAPPGAGNSLEAAPGSFPLPPTAVFHCDAGRPCLVDFAPVAGPTSPPFSDN